MRRAILAGSLILAATLFVGSYAGAAYYDYELAGSAAPQVGVHYTVGGDLTVLGGAGLSVEAYSAAGAPVSGAVVFGAVAQVPVPWHTPDASTLFVRVDGQWYVVYGSTEDPDWGYD